MLRCISILGCGWLGIPLAQKLIELGYQVHGSTTTQQKLSFLHECGVSPFWIEFSPQPKGEFIETFFQSDLLILTIPFKRTLQHPIFYQKQIESVIKYLESSRIRFVIFTSSTLVYPALNRTFCEEDIFIPDNERSQILLAIEKMLLENSHFKTTILRLGGLYGPDRQLGKFLQGKRDDKNGDAAVNLIHIDDVIGIIIEIIKQNVRGEVFNACSDDHPTRKELYALEARKLGIDPPIFPDHSEKKFKIINNAYLKRRLGYHFQYPSPRE